MDGDLLTLVQQNVTDIINDNNNIKSVLFQQIRQFTSVQRLVATFEKWQLRHGTRLDQHDKELMHQQGKLQEVEETLERLLRFQGAINERLSIQVHALQEGLAKTDDKVEQLEQGVAAMTGKIQHEVEPVKQGLTAVTGKVKQRVEQLEQGLTAVTGKVQYEDEQVKQGPTVMTGKVKQRVEQLEQGLTAMTGKVEHFDQGVESLKMKDIKQG